MKGAVIFVFVFVLFVLIGLAGIALPPGDWIVQQYIPDLLQTDYAHIAEGIINGVIFGIIIWAAFSILMIKLRGPKENQVKMEPTPALSQSTSSRIIEIEGIGSTYAKKLNTQGIKTTDDILEKGGTKQGRKELAKNGRILSRRPNIVLYISPIQKPKSTIPKAPEINKNRQQLEDSS